MRFGFNTLRPAAVNHSKNAAPLVRLGNNYFHRIGAGAIDVHHFGNRFDAVQNVNREAVSQRDNEDMTSRNRRGVLNGILLE